MPDTPKNIDIGLYKARRSSPRWEGLKGFIRGALPAGLLGVVAGAAVGVIAVTLASIFFGPENAMSFTKLGMTGVLDVGLVTGIATGAFSGAVGGYNYANREQISAMELNNDLDKLIAEKALATGLGQAPTVLRDGPAAHAPSKGWVSKLGLDHPVDNMSKVLGENGPAKHVQNLLDAPSSPSEPHR